ncbi:hypothetical protein N657DRAFT_623982 [Parathielavia appendiculata]|uniref:Transcription activator GCR1-like domain-containing protein n=1 Tax=Parathielavia appendiculata TaxID=2587402 RepID=A0AAN6TUI3_9PEZI|nr:hypothetical protein N657DRAFT_623982 [Parathielavia appendiculata]
MISPGLERWKGRFGPGAHQINDLAAMGLTNLLFYLREVILQDSALLMPQFPDNPVWNHPVFQHEAYRPYAQQVLAFAQGEERPSQLAMIAQALPTLLTTGLTFEVKAAGSQVVAAAAAAVLPPRPEGKERGESRYTATQSSSESNRATSLGPARTDDAPEPQPPQYRMYRAVKTVEGLWHEWTVGLRGMPAIAALDRKWGSRWRAGRRSELQWYHLRLEVIKEIQRVAQAQRIGEQAAIYIVNMQQQRTGCSLDQFCKRLRANRKEGEAGRPAVQRCKRSAGASYCVLVVMQQYSPF